MPLLRPLPLLVISPFAKSNHVDRALAVQISILRFIEDNWLSHERIQPGGSFDTIAESIDSMFDFGKDDGDKAPRLILNETTGAVVLSAFNDDRDDHSGDRH